MQSPARLEVETYPIIWIPYRLQIAFLDRMDHTAQKLAPKCECQQDAN